MKRPTLKLATWADYADVVNDRMTILRAYSFADVPEIPCHYTCLAAIQIEADDLSPAMSLHLQLKTFESQCVAETTVLAQPLRTLTDRCVFQLIAEFQFQMHKHEYSLWISNKDDGFVIGQLALPVVTNAMKSRY